jgi:hypothetical protein
MELSNSLNEIHAITVVKIELMPRRLTANPVPNPLFFVKNLGV